MDLDLLNTLSKVSLFAPASVTATGNQTGVKLTDYIGGAIVQLVALNTAGASPTLDVKLQGSADGSTNWADITGATFSQVTASANQVISLAIADVPAYVRAVFTIGGTSSPAFVVTVTFFGRKQLI